MFSVYLDGDLMATFAAFNDACNYCLHKGFELKSVCPGLWLLADGDPTRGFVVKV